MPSFSTMNSRHLFDNKENKPPAGPKPFEAFSTVSYPQYGRPEYPRKELKDVERQALLDKYEKDHANDICFGPELEFYASVKPIIAMEWHGLKYTALTGAERAYVGITASLAWDKELASRRRRYQEAHKKWMESLDISYQAIQLHTKALAKKKIERSNMPHETTREYFKLKLDREIYAAKNSIQWNEEKLETLQKVDAASLKTQAEDACLGWKRYNPAKKNEKKPVAKKTGRKTTAARERSQESPVSAGNVTTGITEYGRSHHKPDAIQNVDSRKRKRGPTRKECDERQARLTQDRLRTANGDSEGESDIDEALSKIASSKKRKIAPESDDQDAEKGQIGVARRVTRSMKKVAEKKNTSWQRDDKESPVPATSSDTPKPISSDKKEQSSSPPTSPTSTSTKRKHPSSVNNKQPASKKQMLDLYGTGKPAPSYSYAGKDTEEEDNVDTSQHNASSLSGRKKVTPRSRKSMSPPPAQQPRSLSVKRKSVTFDNEQPTSKRQALNVNGGQMAMPVANNSNLQLDVQELIHDNGNDDNKTHQRKKAVPKTRKTTASVDTPALSNNLDEQRQPTSPDVEQVSSEERPSILKVKITPDCTSDNCTSSSNVEVVEKQSIPDAKEDKQPDAAIQGKEEEAGREESKQEGHDDVDTAASFIADSSEVPSIPPVTAPVVPKKKFSLKDYKAARPKAFEALPKHEAQAEDNEETEEAHVEGVFLLKDAEYPGEPGLF